MAGDEVWAWGFPGQGVGWNGVVARLAIADGHPAVRALVARTGVVDWSAVGSADAWKTQAAILTASVVGIDEAESVPTVIVGHSFGELAALVAGGVVTGDDALTLALLRGELGSEVQQRTGGAMLAVVGVDATEVERLRVQAVDAVGGTCTLAVLNHAVQVVLSGTPATLAWVETKAEALGGRAHLLPIAGPYHTPAMADVAGRYRAAVAEVGRRAPSTPVVLSTDDRPVLMAGDVDDLPDRLAAGLVAPVDWPRALTQAKALGATRGLDIGPGNVLARIGRRAGLAFDALWSPPVDDGPEVSRPGGAGGR